MTWIEPKQNVDFDSYCTFSGQKISANSTGFCKFPKGTNCNKTNPSFMVPATSCWNSRWWTSYQVKSQCTAAFCSSKAQATSHAWDANKRHHLSLERQGFPLTHPTLVLDSSCVFRTYIFHYGLGGGAWEITVVVVDHFQSPQLFHTTGHLALYADEPWQDRGNLAVSAPSERSRLELYYGPNRLGPQLLPDSQAPPVRRGYLCRCRLPSNPETCPLRIFFPLHCRGVPLFL